MRALQPQLTFPENLQSYGSLLVRSLRASFAYRGSTLTSVLTSAVIYAIPILIWKQVYAQKGAHMAIPAEKLFPYLLLAACVSYGLQVGIEWRVGQRIRSGLIATDLLKPIDFQLSQAFQCLSDCVFNGMLGVVVFLFGYFFWGDKVFPAGPTAFGLSLLSFILAFFVMFGICFVFVQGIFYTYAFYGIMTARSALHITFSGLSAPLTAYPPLLQRIAHWLPFRHTINTPVIIYMGWARGPEAWHLIGEQALWVAGLFLLGRFLMGRSIRQLEVQGG